MTLGSPAVVGAEQASLWLILLSRVFENEFTVVVQIVTSRFLHITEAVFPALQGGPHNATIGALAFQLKQAGHVVREFGEIDDEAVDSHIFAPSILL